MEVVDVNKKYPTEKHIEIITSVIFSLIRLTDLASLLMAVVEVPLGQGCLGGDVRTINEEETV